MASTNFTISVPQADAPLATIIAERMGWTINDCDTLIKQFSASRPKNVPITEDEIIEELRAVRYGI